MKALLNALPISLRASLSAFLIAAVAGPTIQAEELTQEQTKFFESKIRPALVKHCYKCHSEDGDKVKGGLLLDTREMSRYGGDSGPAVVPHDLNESLLYVAISYEDSSMEMPPKYKLDDDVIADFKTWIEMGAPDPRERIAKSGLPAEYTNTIDIEEGRKHWAYQALSPINSSSIPESEWSHRTIDTLIDAKRVAAGLTPAPDADPRTLLRRLSFDLTGLPPAPSSIEPFVSAFEEDPDNAVNAIVDDLLESPQFGERFGRRWLDVARYGESSGKEVNATFPHAWRYRDYVIDSFNEDKPFDQFITEQIAGDLLQSDTPEEKNEQLIATSFLAIGTKGLNEQNARQYRFDLVDEQIDTTTQAFLATTVACARCHDHKFDPIPMSDYYAMAGIFLSSDTLYGTANAIQNRRGTELISLHGSVDTGKPGKTLGELISMEFQKTQFQDRLRELTQQAQEMRRAGDGDGASDLLPRLLQLRNQVGIITNELASYDDDGNYRAVTMGVRDRDEPFDSQILIRGEEDNPTPERVPRGMIQAIQTNEDHTISGGESGRLQMAAWITSPENPLTARVFVNRVWSWMFGEGLVSSVDNFGTTGELPSHPELLDYLALRFIESGWSVKELVRDMATSRTYRMSSDYNEAHFVIDPENRLFWRTNKRRLDAESLRDATLAVSNQLEKTRPIGSLVAEAGDGFIGRTVREAQINQPTNTRSVYLPIVRGLVPESLTLFDFADPSLISGKREVTTVPSQALYLMNSDFVTQSAEKMASYLVTDLNLRGKKLSNTAFYLAYSRPPTEDEGLRTRDYIERFLKVAADSGMSDEEARILALTTFCQSLISSAEFRYLN